MQEPAGISGERHSGGQIGQERAYSRELVQFSADDQFVAVDTWNKTLAFLKCWHIEIVKIVMDENVLKLQSYELT